MEQLTLHNLPSDLALALEEESHRLREPLEQTVIELLRQALKVRAAHERSNGLARLAGTWTKDEYEDFESAIAVTEQLDEELWR
jgi:hypothetical protein